MVLIATEVVSDPAIVDQAKRTYYNLHGKEIVAQKRKVGRPKVFRNPEFKSLEEKTDAAALYCVYGDLNEVAKITGIEVKVLKAWKEEPWWFEVQKQVFVEQNEKLAAQLSSTLNKTLDELNERLEKGDYTYNPKTGLVTRKPIEAKVIASIFDSLSHQRRITRGEPTSIALKVGVDDRLKRLEESFIRFAEAKIINGDTAE